MTPGLKPRRGGLFIVPAPLPRRPNPGGVTCPAFHPAAWEHKLEQVTPPGFGERGSSASTINRPPPTGFEPAPAFGSKATQQRRVIRSPQGPSKKMWVK